ncbi:NADPH-dependent FMN reductase, partial [Shinella sumterensis]|uniref:NADPH-dependent FMN reductase n=1 Tax=Shinella sumterensis TaxID=1967501 RepID=UPI003F850BDC
MTTRLTIALIYGSGREGRFADTVAGWLEPELAGFSHFDIVRIDAAELVFTPGGLDEASAALVESRISQADAFLIVTPEYNHAYPAALKAIIDSCFRPWHAKPVAFISYG